MFVGKINQSINKKKGSLFPRPSRPCGDCYEFPTAIPSNAILTCGVPSLSIRGTRWSGAYLASRRFMRTSKRSPSVKRAANSEMRGGSGDPPEFAQSCPPQPSEETVGSGSQTTAMRGQWCTGGRDGQCSLSSSFITHVQSTALLPSTPVEMDISCCHSPKRLWNGFQTSREPPSWLRFQVVTMLLQVMHPWLWFAPDVWLYPLICLEGEAGSELILSRDGRENSLWADTSESAHCFPLSFLPLM